MELGDLTAKLKIDTSDLDRAIDRVERRLATANLHLNTSDIDASIDRTTGKFSGLGDESERTSKRIGAIHPDIDTTRMNRSLDSTERRLASLGSVLTKAGLVVSLAGITRWIIALTTALAPGLNILAAAPTVILGAASAFATLKLGFSGFGDALKALNSGDIKKFNAAIAGMAPEAVAVVKALGKLNTQFVGLRKNVQAQLFADLVKPIERLADASLPTLNKGLSAIASSFNRTARATFEASSTPFFQGKLAIVFEETAHQASILGSAMPNLAKGLVSLAASGEPVITRFTQFVAKGLDTAGAFLSSAAGAERMTAVLNKAGDVLGQFFRITVNLGDGLKNIFKLGGIDGFLTHLEAATKAFDNFTKSAQGQKDIQTVFKALSDLTSHLGQTLPLIGRVIVDVLGAIESLPGPMKDALFQTIAWSIALGPLITGLSSLSRGVKGIVDVGRDIGKVGKAIKDLPNSKVVKLAQNGAETAALKVLYLKDAVDKLTSKSIDVSVKGTDAAKSGAASAKTFISGLVGGIAGGIGGALAGVFSGAAILEALAGAGAAVAAVVFSVPALIIAATVAASAAAFVFRKQIARFLTGTLPSAFGEAFSAVGTFLTSEVPRLLSGAFRILRTTVYHELPHLFGEALGAAAALAALEIGGVITAIVFGITKGLPAILGAANRIASSIGMGILSATSGVQSAIGSVVSTILSGLGRALAAVPSLMAGIGSAISSGFSTAIASASSFLSQLPGIVSGFFGQAVGVAHDFAITFVNDPIGTLEGLVTGFNDLLGRLPGIASSAFTSVLNIVSSIMSSVLGSVQASLAATLGAVTGIFGQILQSTASSWNAIYGVIGGALRNIGSNLADAFSSFLGGVSDGWNRINNATGGQLNQWVGIVGGFLNDVVGFFRALPGRLVGAIGDVGGLLTQKGRDIIGGFSSGVSAAYSAVSGFFTRIRNDVLGWVSNPASWLIEAGKDVVKGLINGVSQMFGPLGDAAKKVGNFFIGTVKSTLGVHSPSAVMHGIGTNVMQGLVNGIESQRGMLKRTLANVSGDVSALGLGSPLVTAGYAAASSSSSSSVTQEFNLNISPVPFSAAQMAQEGVSALQNMARTQKYK